MGRNESRHQAFRDRISAVACVIVFLELMAVTLLATLFCYGELGRGVLYYVVATAGAALVCAALALWMPRRTFASLATHGALALGCLLFALPFFWLVLTSFKEPREVTVFPPRWLPGAPHAAPRSPFLSGQLIRDRKPLVPIREERWLRLRAEAESTLAGQAVRLLTPDHVRGLDPSTFAPTLGRGLWANVAGGLAQTAWDEPDEAIVKSAAARMDRERLGEVWALVLRAVALRDPIVTDDTQRDVSLGPPVQPWQAVTDNVRTSHRPRNAGGTPPPAPVR
jgi:hypothetical protein